MWAGPRVSLQNSSKTFPEKKYTRVTLKIPTREHSEEKSRVIVGKHLCYLQKNPNTSVTHVILNSTVSFDPPVKTGCEMNL